MYYICSVWAKGQGLQIFFDACINQIGVEIHLATHAYCQSLTVSTG